MAIFDYDSKHIQVKKTIATSVLFQLLIKVKSLITLPIITAFILPYELGIYSYISIISSLLIPFILFNLIDGPAIYIIQQKDTDLRIQKYITTFNATLVCLAVNMSIVYFVMKLFNLEIVKYFNCLLMLIVADCLFKLTTYIYSLFQDFKKYIYYIIMSDLIATVATIVFAINGFGYRSMIYGVLIGNISVIILSGKNILSEINYNLNINMDYIRTALKLSLSMLPIYVFTFIIDSSDFYFLMKYFGAEKVGIYKIVYSLSSVVLSISVLINFFWTPVSSKLWIKNKARFSLHFKEIISIMLSLILLVTLLYEINSSIIFNLLVRNKIYYESKNILSIIALALSLKVLLVLITGPIYADKKGGLLTLPYILAALTNIIMNIMLIPRWGILGASISTLASYVIATVAMTIICDKSLNLHTFENRNIFSIIYFILIWIIIRNIGSESDYINIIITNIVTLTVTFFLFVRYFLNKNEKIELNGIWKKCGSYLKAS